MLFSALLNEIEYENSVSSIDVHHITNDSREAHDDSVFVCVRGFATDGHMFASKAYANGCRAFVAERSLSLPPNASVAIVSDSRRALALLSRKIYGDPSRELLVIGITGTKGKTTTALMIKQLLDGAGIPAGYIGSNGVIYGNRKIAAANTTPESHKLQGYMRDMLDSSVKAVVMEVSSQALKLNRVLGVKFDITIFTNLSPDHIGPTEHKSFEDYFLTKKKLFDEFDAPVVIANADDEYTDKILADCKSEKVFYSINNPSSYRATNIEPYFSNDILGTHFLCHTENGTVPVTLSIPGDFNVHNALCTIAVVNKAGIGCTTATQILSDMQIDGRFETLIAPNGACFVIDYAHNGLSLMSALTALRRYEPRRLICLFGSVGCRTQVRRAQMGNVAAKYADLSILTSDNPDTEDPLEIINDIAAQFGDGDKYVSIPDRAEAIKYALSIAEKGDIILLAGKGHERYQLINGRNEYFCEKEIIEDLINEIRLTK